MGRARSCALGLTLLVGACAPVLLSPGTACAAAASGAPHAALVVDTGTRTTTYCVALDGGSVSGTHLIELASAQFGLDYRFGFAGRAICRLDEVGVDGDDCFGDYPNYWGYFHGDAAGGWAWASGSAADHAVEDGEVEGWSWGTGDSGTTHPAPPALSIDDVCDRVDSPSPSPSPPVPEPSPSPSGGGGGGGGSGGSGGTDDGSAGGSGGTDDGASSGAATAGPSSVSSPNPRAHPASGSPTSPAGSSPAAAAPSSADPDVVRAAAASPPASGGPPIGGLVTVAAIALLGLAGWFNLRRRKGGT